MSRTSPWGSRIRGRPDSISRRSWNVWWKREAHRQEGVRRLEPLPGVCGPFHEAAIELIEIPRRSQTGKNSADIRLVVDAMDLSWSKAHVDTFVIVSGDSDFSPLVSKLKENGKHVIGLGMKGSTSELLRDNCDEFIYYEDLEREEEHDREIVTSFDAGLPELKREAFALLVEACKALRRENHEILYASMIKDTIKRKKPSFDESYYGYRSFTHLLEDSDNHGVVDIERNPKSGTYVVVRFGGESSGRPSTPRMAPVRRNLPAKPQSGPRKPPGPG
ncbi:MAG: NYN domain-containing protein [Isosphaeraceae bacterium]